MELEREQKERGQPTHGLLRNVDHDFLVSLDVVDVELSERRGAVSETLPGGRWRCWEKSSPRTRACRPSTGFPLQTTDKEGTAS